MEKEKRLNLVVKEVEKAVKGKHECVEKVLAAIIAGGHILLEDVPGVGKTTMALAFSKAMGLETKRLQFTPDVLPADIVGFNMYNRETGTFDLHKGPINCNLFLADEINRTSPKTQSALLEVMAEGNVTVDGLTYQLPKPFCVIATQNPKGSTGTQLLPESQLDRFMVSISLGYPDNESEIEIIKGRSMENFEEVQKVLDEETVIKLQEEAKDVFIRDSVYEYIVELANATRNNSYIDLGLSPRASIDYTRFIKAYAYYQGRDYVIPDDAVKLFPDVARHRIVLSSKARFAHVREEDVIKEIINEVRKPGYSVKDEENLR